MTSLDQKEEVTYCEAFQICWRDDIFNDIFLEGCDGVKIPANRTALGMRSFFFRTMLFGRFREASNTVVKFDFPSIVLKSIVDYLLTGSTEHTIDLATPFYLRRAKCKKAVKDVSFEVVQLLVSLATAASFMSLPILSKQVLASIADYLKLAPVKAVDFLEACHQEGPASPKDIEDLAVACVIKNAFGFLREDNLSWVQRLSLPTIETIVKDKRIRMSDSLIFHIILEWANCPDAALKNERLSKAPNFVATHVDLVEIHPDILSDEVKASGLVSIHQLEEAYKLKSIRANDRQDIVVNKKRKAPHEGSSGSVATRGVKPESLQTPTRRVSAS
jgi:BTB/POZ domain